MAFPAGILTWEAAGRPPPRPSCSDRDFLLWPLVPSILGSVQAAASQASWKAASTRAGIGDELVWKPGCPGERDHGGRIRMRFHPPRLQSAGRLQPLEGDASPGHGKPLGLRAGFRPAGCSLQPSRSSPCQKKVAFLLKLEHLQGSLGKLGTWRRQQLLCLRMFLPWGMVAFGGT